MLKFLPILLLLLCSACEGNTAALKASRGTNFVPDPNHLFFKNTRARHYRAEEITNRATIYRHDGLFQSEANLRLVLIDNWLQDRAVIRLELTPELSAWAETWSLMAGNGTQSAQKFTLSTPPTNEELDQLLTSLQSTDNLYLSIPADTLRLAFPNEAGRKHARTVIKDYLTLVGY